MIAFIQWYVLITILGWVAFPLAFSLLPGLPDRGYSLSRALGLMLAAFVFWLFGSLGLLGNTVGAILLSILIVAGLSGWALTRAQPFGWLRDNLSMVITVEVLFLVAFAGWVLVRAGNPSIRFTEKPMELAFLNGIRMSDRFPPMDPWLSGYSISYYYFGYVMVAMLADLSGAATAVAFNLGVALIFALTVIGAYGVVYNLSEHAGVKGSGVGALLGPIFVAIVGNLTGFLDWVRVRGWLPDGFWAWLDVQDLNVAYNGPVVPLHEVRGGWYWRASRVIHDRLPIGETAGLQPIDEFPMFSFLLADLHPHVLALPFVLLALAMAFNALTQRERLTPPQMGLYVVAFGGLAFLNAWDLPIYLFVLFGALVVRGIRERGGLDPAGVLVPLLGAGGIVLAMLVVYFPWVVSFTSQAGGVLPNAFFPTRFQQIVVMFGVFLPLVLWFLTGVLRDPRAAPDVTTGFLLAGGLLLLLIVTMSLLGVLGIRLDEGARGFAFTATGTETLGGVLRETAIHRLSHPVTPLALTALIGLLLALLLPLPARPDGPQPEALPHALVFALVLMLTAALLVLGPEFVYLRDNFGQRINTIFKFYYAAWVLFAVGAAFAANWLLATLRGLERGALSLLTVGVVAAGLIYPVNALPSRGVDLARGVDEPPLTLYGLDYVQREHPAEHEALQWLMANADPDDVVLEAVGGAYSDHGRVASMTGVPTVMGWANHQRQWRGDLFDELAGPRENHVREIYNTADLNRARELLDQYSVTYIYVGRLERSPEFASPNGLAKFERYFEPVFRNEAVTIYAVGAATVEEAQ